MVHPDSGLGAKGRQADFLGAPFLSLGSSPGNQAPSKKPESAPHAPEGRKKSDSPPQAPEGTELDRPRGRPLDWS